MTKYLITRDEWYPILRLAGNEDGSFTHREHEMRDFTDEEIAEIRRIETEFNDLQIKLSALCGEDAPTWTLIW